MEPLTLLNSDAALREALQQYQVDYARDPRLCWIPIRHHSPQCAAMAVARLTQFQPDIVLIEGPASFAKHLSILQSEHTEPPIAIFQNAHYFPLALNSPEWQAIRWAGQHDVPVQFIDAENVRYRHSPAWSNDRFLRSEYARQLRAHWHCRDDDELWHRLFEQSHQRSATEYFRQVLLFCAASRACFDPVQRDDHEDLRREQHMRFYIHQAYQQHNKVAVITGGFHTPALLDFSADHLRHDSDAAMDSFVVRYSDELLDANNGYAAGMPYPAICRWLYQQRHLADDEWLLYLMEQVTPLPLIERQGVFAHLNGLLQLRQIQRAGSFEILDALTSCIIKEEASAKITRPWRQALAGRTLGKLPNNLPSLPLVEDIVEQCRRHRLTIEAPSNSHFDLWDLNGSSQQRRQLLCKLAFLNIDFAHVSSGESPSLALKSGRRYEHWHYHWTPQVETHLIPYAPLGSRLDNLVVRLLDEQDHVDLASSLDMYVYAIMMGLSQHFCVASLQALIGQCCDISVLVKSFSYLFRVSLHPLMKHETLQPIYVRIWQQISYHLAAINKLPLKEALELLMVLQGIAQQHAAQLGQSWREQIHWLLQHNQHTPPLYFALHAMHIELTNASPDTLLAQLKTRPDQFDIVEALIVVVPHWLRQDNTLLQVMNDWLAQQSQDDFITKLPTLRRLFSQFDAPEIRQITQQLKVINQWQQVPNWSQPELSEDDVMQGCALEKQLRTTLRSQGLEQWITL